MKKILSLALGMTFALGTLAFAQDSQGAQSQGSSTQAPTDQKSTKKQKKHKKSKDNDKMSTDAPKAQ